MKKICFAALLSLCCMLYLGYTQAQSEGPSDNMLISGFKEALSIGTEKAVKMVSQTDGYFGNQLIKILMPEKMNTVASALAKAGMQKQVDDFVLSMNRAAEKAAPQAASIFGGAIKEMGFEDANKIYTGGDTAATEFFKGKTSEKIYSAFKPIISSSMGQVGTTTMYNGIMSKYNTIPLVPKVSVDIEDYVTNKAMDGLFMIVGQEEKKIRTDPAARATDLLKSVFGK
jgi:hypothetical protein